MIPQNAAAAAAASRTSSPFPLSDCGVCGQRRYVGLVHHCGTALLRPFNVTSAAVPTIFPFPVPAT